MATNPADAGWALGRDAAIARTSDSGARSKVRAQKMTRRMLPRQIFKNLRGVAIAGTFLFATQAFAYSQSIIPDVSWGGKELPASIPRIVDTNGNILFLDPGFTSIQYQRCVLDSLLKEANEVALDLNLKENIPITASNLVRAYISPFGFAYSEGSLGNVSTANYVYGAERDLKFSDITVTKIDDRCRGYAEQYEWPLSLFDTNAAYQLATQWLDAVHMDVAGLNRDYEAAVAVDPYWNNVRIGELPKHTFTPIYYVSWLVKGKPPYSAGGGASVELFLPTKTLLSLKVDDSRHILREPIAFTNLAALFPGKANVVTNFHVKHVTIDAPGS